MFRLDDNVIVRNHSPEMNGLRGVIVCVTEHNPPPFQVRLDSIHQIWCNADQLMLDCLCEPIWAGCRCGASAREKEANATE